MRLYAGIGSRETPWETLEKMTKIATYLEKHKWVLRSGGAQGADQAFEAGLHNGKNAQIFLPRDDLPLWTNIFTDHFHPAPDRLKPYSRQLMNRNAMQILGEDGNTPVEMVVCWTKDGKASGGTGQAIRIAEYYDIPIFNLKNDGAIEQLKRFLRGH
jgi:hypothetical protein